MCVRDVNFNFNLRAHTPPLITPLPPLQYPYLQPPPHHGRRGGLPKRVQGRWHAIG